MRRFLPYIFIISLVMQIFAPFSVATKKAFAETNEEKYKHFSLSTWDLEGYKKAFEGSYIRQNGSMYSETTDTSDITMGVVVDTGIPEGDSAWSQWWHVKPKGGVGNYISDFLKGMNQIGLNEIWGNNIYNEFEDENTFIFFIEEKGTEKKGYLDITKEILGTFLDKRNSPSDQKSAPVKVQKSIPVYDVNPIKTTSSNGISKIEPGKSYTFSLYYLSTIEQELKAYPELNQKKGDQIPGLENNGFNYIKIANAEAESASKDNQVIVIPLDEQVEGGVTSGNSGDNMLPKCTIYNLSVSACISQGLYFLFFKPTSFLFAMSGKLLDVTLMYSVSDTSYRSAFIAEAWKTVRDICNMFFIFVLLYVAFQMMLNMADAKTKSLVAHVVLVGIIMNFSLFFAQVVIDASNIMARVFYNPKTMIVEKKVGSNKEENLLGQYGEIKISEGIVDAFDPVKIIMNAKNTSEIGGDDVDEITKSANGVSAKTIIIISILSTVINVLGMLAFLSISMFLIGRVVSLWMIMILSPIAILSYALPDKIQSSMKDFGAKEWWGKLISVSFMAPVLVFFLYIILLFASKGLGIWGASSGQVTGLNYLISVILPFAIVLILITEAKNRAKEMSDKIGQFIGSALPVVAGVVAGTAAIGTGALLKKGIGGVAGRMSTGSTSVQKYETAKNAEIAGDSTLINELKTKDRILGGGLSLITGGWKKRTVKDQRGNPVIDPNTGMEKKEYRSIAGTISGKSKVEKNNQTGKVEITTGEKGLGGLINERQKKVDEIEKARGKIDDSFKEAGLEGEKFENLSASDVKKVKEAHKKKNKDEYVTNIKEGDVTLKNKDGSEYKDKTGQTIKGEHAFRSTRESELTDEFKAANNGIGPDKKEKGIIKQKIEIELKALIKSTLDEHSNEKFKENLNKSRESISMADRGISGASRHSYNPMNLENLKSDRRDSIWSKIPKTFIVSIATAVRMGVKGANMGVSGYKKDQSPLKNISEILTETFKPLVKQITNKK